MTLVLSNDDVEQGVGRDLPTDWFTETVHP